MQMLILTSNVDGQPSENKIRRSLDKNTKNTKQWHLKEIYKEIQKLGDNGVRLADSQADTFTKQLPI